MAPPTPGSFHDLADRVDRYFLARLGRRRGGRRHAEDDDDDPERDED